MKKHNTLAALEQRHIDFAEACIRGESQTDAYLKHIAKSKSRRSAAANAARLAADPLIEAYTKKRLKQLKKAGLIETDRALTALSGIVTRQTPDYQLTKDGEVVEVPARLSDVIAAARILLDRSDKADEAKSKKTQEERYGVIIMPPTQDTEGSE